MCGIMDTIIFLVLNQLSLWGALDAVRDKKGCGLFDYTVTQNKEQATVYSNTPQSATYVLHDIKNTVMDISIEIFEVNFYIDWIKNYTILY